MDKPLTHFAKLVLLTASLLAVVVGPVLFFWPHHTHIYFAWHIKNPLTAMFMGASYLAGLANLLAIKENRWSLARVQLPSIFTFAVLMLLATLLHLSVFNWQHPIAWAWLAVYVFSPAAALWVWITSDRHFQAPVFNIVLPVWLKPVMMVFFWFDIALGTLLFLFPQVISAYWPWTLTPLTSRILGGWFLSAAMLNYMLSKQHFFETAKVALLANGIVATFLLFGLGREYGLLSGPTWATVLYGLRVLVIGGVALIVIVKYPKNIM
jgi:hypothetical protein